MLTHLTIQHFALIQHLELDFYEGFTVITGETGSGKSILIDALCMVLGGRVDTSCIRSGETFAEVQAIFDIQKHLHIQEKISHHALEHSDKHTLLIRRIIAPKRSKIFINGHLVTLHVLTHIVSGLVEISGQHEQQQLLSAETHLSLLDAYGNIEHLKQVYTQAYEHQLHLKHELEQLNNTEKQFIQQADFIAFQCQEIEQLKLQPNELEILEQQREELLQMQQTQQALRQALHVLQDAEPMSAIDAIQAASAQLQSLYHHASTEPWLQSLQTIRHELMQTLKGMQRFEQQLEYNPDMLQHIQDRYRAIQRLCKKHGPTLEHVLQAHQSMQQQLHNFEQTEQQRQQLQHNLERATQTCLQAAQTLTQARIETAKHFDTHVMQELADIDLKTARFQTHITQTSSLTHQGQDTVHFYWSANSGEEPRALHKIASGGELSRVMLAIKSTLRHNDWVSLYVFDEVDTGLGGQAAHAIGQKLKHVSQEHQSLVITHLPGIAAQADRHLEVFKQESEQRTCTRAHYLTETEREAELARMIDGRKQSKTTRQAAREMLRRSTKRTASKQSTG